AGHLTLDGASRRRACSAAPSRRRSTSSSRTAAVRPRRDAGVMNDEMLLLAADDLPDRAAALNPFVIVDDAAGLMDFVTEVFGLAETAEAHTEMPDGKLIHAEVRFASVNLMLADRLDGWPARPGLLQVWVTDVGK